MSQGRGKIKEHSRGPDDSNSGRGGQRHDWQHFWWRFHTSQTNWVDEKSPDDEDNVIFV